MLGYLKAPADIVAAKAEETPLGFESTMFMWMAAELLKPARDQQDRMVRVLRDMDAANSPQRAFLFSREFRQSLFDRFSEMNREMFATFATDIPGATFEENLDDIDDYVYREPSGFSEAEFREKLAIVESEIAKKSGASFHQGVGQPAGRRKPKPAAKRRQGRTDGPEVLRSDMAAQRGTAVKKRVSSTSISAGPAPGTGGGPDFLGIGAAKAGTGWLYDQLALHPEVWMPPIKELHYFANETRQHAFGPRISSIMVKTLSRFQRQYDRDRCASLNAKRIKMFNKPLDERDIIFLKLATTPETAAGLDAYANFFSLKGDALSGEITPAYSTLKPAVVKEINERFPRLKLVFLARDPIGRALSHLQLYRRQADANPTGPFRDFDLQNVDSIRAVLGKENTDVRSRPTETIRRWRQFFPAEQLHIELFDDLGSDAAGVRARIFRFLGISPEKGGEAIPADFNRKSTQTKYPITPQARDLLIELYRDEILACAEAFGGAAKTWPAKYGLA
jgi:hypothetical protein